MLVPVYANHSIAAAAQVVQQALLQSLKYGFDKKRKHTKMNETTPKICGFTHFFPQNYRELAATWYRT